MRRVILFDIDGTLVWGGPAKEAFCDAMLETFGTMGAVEDVSFAGKTDPQIARELLAGVGIGDSAIEDGFPALFDRYTEKLAERLVDDPVSVLPGVAELLDALSEIDDVGLALLTGNIVRGAELKLTSAGLWGHFALGSYGSDHEERDALAGIALERAREAWGSTIEAGDTVVVGDTPRDVSCGINGGTRTLAVATGHFSIQQLRDAGPDHAIEDLSNTEGVLALLTG